MSVELLEGDDWEVPTRFWQILSVGGFATNIDDEEKRRLDDAMNMKSHSVTVEDVYGDEVTITLSYIIGIKLWTARGGLRWRKTKAEADGDSDREY